jgi:hypothetical protein
MDKIKKVEELEATIKKRTSARSIGKEKAS